MGRFSDMPEGVFEEIMSWLPPESLKSFKLVRKSWHFRINNLIKNQTFVVKHLRNTKNKIVSYPSRHFRNLSTITDPEGPNDSLKGTYLLTVASADPCGVNDYIPCVGKDLKYLTSTFPGWSFKVVSQCNGIICFYAYDCHKRKDNIFLLNPALRELKIVPDGHFGTHDEIRGVGFGYDSRNNDYKVVSFKSEDEIGFGPYKAQVYSLSTNSWKQIKMDVSIVDVCDCEYQVVYFKGVCYWYYWDLGGQIMSFDFCDEVFRRVPLPNNAPRELLESYKFVGKQIAVWNESLVLFFKLGANPLIIDMWVLDSCSNGVEGSCSWTRHLTIGPLVGIKRPIAFWNSEELFMENENCHMISYNIRTQKLGGLPIHMEWLCSRLVICEKSVVSVLSERRGEA